MKGSIGYFGRRGISLGAATACSMARCKISSVAGFDMHTNYGFIHQDNLFGVGMSGHQDYWNALFRKFLRRSQTIHHGHI